MTAIHDELDGSFARRHPACAVPGHLAALCEAVKRTGAAVGIAFDGDGDWLALVDGLPRFHVSPDLRLRMPAEEIAVLQGRLLTQLPAAEVDRTDGVRLVWPEGWLLARGSVTEQGLILRFEGREARDISAVAERFLGVFPDLRARVSEALTPKARYAGSRSSFVIGSLKGAGCGWGQDPVGTVVRRRQRAPSRRMGRPLSSVAQRRRWAFFPCYVARIMASASGRGRWWAGSQ